MSDYIVDAIRRIPIPEGYDHGSPIFCEPPENIDESWTHGAMVGGLGWLTEQADIARAYRCAANALIDRALAEQLSWQVAYPALFLYRHAVEVTLKALFPNAPKDHSLAEMIERADQRIQLFLPLNEAAWVKERLSEFAIIDPRSTAFRFAGAKLRLPSGADGEWWIDYAHLQQTMEVVLQLLEVLAWGGEDGVAVGAST